FGCKRCDGFDNGLLIVLPACFVECNEGRCLCCHGCLLLVSEDMLLLIGSVSIIAWGAGTKLLLTCSFLGNIHNVMTSESIVIAMVPFNRNKLRRIPLIQKYMGYSVHRAKRVFTG